MIRQVVDAEVIRTIEDTRLAVSPGEAAKRLYVSKAHVYRMVKSGEIKSARLGGRILIPVSELERVIAGAR